MLTVLIPLMGGYSDQDVCAQTSARCTHRRWDRVVHQVQILVGGAALLTTGSRGAAAGVIVSLVVALGVKYARLSLDWVHQQGQPPNLGEVARFVVWIVEAAAVDGGREPLLWKIQQAITGLLDCLLGGRDGQAEEIQSTVQVGAVSAGP